ncbi:hypothetical protein ORJ00_07960 [Rheinheimera baltica]|uniref:hypothetical protein n=1 Tax=Rheinheimera baltica TaxID=67576 RepID=UPI00273EFE41|nr:hypothetical protein [Rheinheimera baltica]MDP5142669.1 hypothetical protein [Rheinheimera baltica]
MHALTLKFTNLYVPFLLFSILLLVSYNLIRWLLDIKLAVIPLTTELLDIWLPMLLPWLCIPLWLKQRITLLRGAGWQKDSYFAYYFVINFSIAGVIVVSQINLVSAPFSLIPLQHVNDAVHHPTEQYFDIKAFSVQRSRCRNTQFTNSISTRGGTTYYFHSHYICPFSQSDNLWYAMLYSRSYDANFEDSPRQLEQQRFYAEAKQQFARLDMLQVSYFERLRLSDDLKALQNIIPAAAGQPLVLRARHGPFSQRQGRDYRNTLYAFATAAVVVLIMLLVAKIEPPAQLPINTPGKNKPGQAAKKAKPWRRRKNARN